MMHKKRGRYMDAQMELKGKSVFQLISDSVKFFLSDKQQLLKVTSLSFAIVLIVAILFPVLFLRLSQSKTTASVLQLFLTWLSTFLSVLIVVRASLSLVDQEKDFSSWIEHSRRQLGKVFVYSILAILIYVGMITIVSALVLLIIAMAKAISIPFLGGIFVLIGIIAGGIAITWYALKFMLVPYALVIDDLPVRESFLKAFRLSKGRDRMLKFIAFFFTLVLIGILSLIGILVIVMFLGFVLSLLPVVVVKAITSGVYAFLISALGVFYSIAIYLFYRYLCALAGDGSGVDELEQDAQVQLTADTENAGEENNG